jgi:hypothetical protein
VTLPIAIELAPGHWADTTCATVLVEACARGAGSNGCSLLEGESVGTARAMAIVWFDDDKRRARISVAVPNGAESSVRSRELTFREQDPSDDRCRAAGLVVASLASVQLPPAQPPPETHDRGLQESTGDVPPPNVDTTAATMPPGWSLGAAGLLGQGVQGGPGRVGGFGQVAYAGTSGLWLLTAYGSYAHTWSDPQPGLSMSWVALGGGGGIGLPLPALHVTVRMRFEGFVEWTLVSLRDRERTTQTDHTTTVGSRTAIEVVWPLERHIGLVVGMDGTMRFRPTVIRLEGAPSVTVPVGAYTGYLGIQVALGR